MSKPEKQVAKATGQALVEDAELKGLPAYLKRGEVRGNENVELQDILVPRVELIQPLSPARDPDDAAYIEGAKEGMLFNTVTRHLYGTSLKFIPILFRNSYLVFRERDLGGGFRGSYSTLEQADAFIKTLDKPDEYAPIQCAEHYVSVIANDTALGEEAFLAMTKTKLKISRQLNSLILGYSRRLGLDRFARVFTLSAVREENDKGKYWNFKVELAPGIPSERQYFQAEELYTRVAQGSRRVRADMSDVDGQTDSDDDM